MEDRSWLHAVSDRQHINISELDSIIKGLEMAVDWKLTKITLYTNSKTAFGWLEAFLSNKHRIRIHGMNKGLIE